MITQLCNAYTELNDPVVQRQRFADQLKVIIYRKQNPGLSLQKFGKCELERNLTEIFV